MVISIFNVKRVRDGRSLQNGVLSHLCVVSAAACAGLLIAWAATNDQRSLLHAQPALSSLSRKTTNTRIERPRRGAPPAVGTLARLELEPVSLAGGSTLHVVTPRRWVNVAQGLTGSLKELHGRYTGSFGTIPSFTTTVRLLDEETFYLTTGAPQWTNAMYYRGQIIIPLPKKGEIDYENLMRSLKHEYTHAVIHALSGGKCPGWLDEGIAQWAEGVENPALRPALTQWLERNKPVPLNLLQGGFTKLETAMVPAAYAQSLYAAQHMIRRHGISRISGYLGRLRSGKDSPTAFRETFGITEREFESALGGVLTTVALPEGGELSSHRHLPHVEARARAK